MFLDKNLFLKNSSYIFNKSCKYNEPKQMRINHTLISILFLIISLTFYLEVAASDDISWAVQIIDEDGVGGNGYCPIIIDSKNNPQMVYTGIIPPYVYGITRNAIWNGLTWNIEEVKDYSTAFSIALDSNDETHIVYGDWETGLVYASHTRSNWRTQVVDENGSFGELVLDSNNQPHIAYTNGQELKYAYLEGGVWTIQLVDRYEDIPPHLSIALDTNKNPYILYTAETSKLAFQNGFDWSIQSLTNFTNLGSIHDLGNIVIDSNDNPRFIYRKVYSDNEITRDLVYASWDGSKWDTQIVDSEVSMNNLAAFLTLDSHNLPHISYIKNSNELMYSYWKNQTWNILPLGENVTSDHVCYLALDSNDNPHISFRVLYRDTYYHSHSYIKYATATINPKPAEPDSFTETTLFLISTILASITVIAIIYTYKHRNTKKGLDVS
jgi:hypothetical protein